MKLYDISMTIEANMMVYKNLEEKKPEFTNAANFETASHYETNLKMNLHTGTHIDAPLHMIKDGETIETYSLERFITKAKVLDFTSVVGMIDAEDLKSKDIKKGDFILLKTQNSFEECFNLEFVSLAEDGAKYLAELDINGVGIDALGIERSQPNHMTHIRLLKAGVIILEGINLKEVAEGAYQMMALPIKIDSVEASPVRAVLIEL